MIRAALILGLMALIVGFGSVALARNGGRSLHVDLDRRVAAINSALGDEAKGDKADALWRFIIRHPGSAYSNQDVDDVAALLDDHDPQVVYAAAASLGRMGPRAHRWEPKLQEMLRLGECWNVEHHVPGSAQTLVLIEEGVLIEMGATPQPGCAY